MSLLSQLSLDPNLVGSLTLKRPEGRAPRTDNSCTGSGNTPEAFL